MLERPRLRSAKSPLRGQVRPIADAFANGEVAPIAAIPTKAI